ncbi:glycosyltransferase family 4 protein [candidate division KSB1 bacterium]|nr:glycosyltransferase family 4 protein [candidate division KSB1 bacterium]
MKKIAINATMLTPQSGGILVYILNLIETLIAHEPDIQVLPFFSNNFLAQFPQYAKLPHARGLNLSGERPRTRVLLDALVLPRLLNQCQIDLFHSPISYFPFGVTIPAVLTIHDLRAFHFPENYDRIRGAFLRKRITGSARKAEKIIAISDYTKDDIISTLKIPAQKVVRIHQGFAPARFDRRITEEELDRIRKRYQLPEKYILSIGHLEPRKNFSRLIRAFHQLRQEAKIPHKLIIIGRETWNHQLFYEEMHRLNLQDAVIFTGFVEDDDLTALYHTADICVLPSLFEGFGFSPLESMAAGTAVVCSNTTSFPEICGNAAEYFDPHKVEDMSATILKVLQNETLKRSLILQGFENIKRFSFEKCAHETAAVYRGALDQDACQIAG